MAVKDGERRTRDPHRRDSRNFPIPAVADVGDFGGYFTDRSAAGDAGRHHPCLVERIARGDLNRTTRSRTRSGRGEQIRRAGVGGFLQSNASSEQIVQAIKSVASGLMVFDRALAPQSPDDELLEQLTSRENEVLRLLADGLGNKEIAVKLSISEHTIKFHIHSILGKLGAASRTEAVTRGLRRGIIEL